MSNVRFMSNLFCKSNRVRNPSPLLTPLSFRRLRYDNSIRRLAGLRPRRTDLIERLQRARSRRVARGGSQEQQRPDAERGRKSWQQPFAAHRARA